MNIRKLVPALMASCLAMSAGAVPLAPKNPYLADSVYPMPHAEPSQQDVLPVAGPVDVTRKLKPEEIDYQFTGPAFFGIYTSGVYPDGKRVMWGNGLDRIVKIDFDSYEVMTTRMLDGVEHYTEEQANESIAYFDDNKPRPTGYV